MLYMAIETNKKNWGAYEYLILLQTESKNPRAADEARRRKQEEKDAVESSQRVVD